MFVGIQQQEKQNKLNTRKRVKVKMLRKKRLLPQNHASNFLGQ